MKRLSTILFIIVSWLLASGFTATQTNTGVLKHSTEKKPVPKIVKRPNLVAWNAWVTRDSNNNYTCHANIKNISDTAARPNMVEIFFNGRAVQRLTAPMMPPNSVHVFNMQCNTLKRFAGHTVRAHIKVDVRNQVKEILENDNFKNFIVAIPVIWTPIARMTATMGNNGRNLYFKVTMRENVTNFSDLKVLFANKYAPLHHIEADEIFVFGPYPLSFAKIGNGLDTLALAYYKNKRTMKLRIKIEPKFSVAVKGCWPIQ